MQSQTSLVAEQVRLQQWADQIRSCQARPSDMKVIDWCAQNGISKANYYYRLKCVRQACLKASNVNEKTFVEISVPQYANADVATNDSIAAVIHFPNQISLELNNSASKEFIRNIFGALAYVK